MFIVLNQVRGGKKSPGCNLDGDNCGLATFSYSIRRREKPPVYERQRELCSLGLWVFLAFLFRRSLTRPVVEFF